MQICTVSAFGSERKFPSTTLIFSVKSEPKSAAEGHREDQGMGQSFQGARDILGNVLRLPGCLQCALCTLKREEQLRSLRLPCLTALAVGG